MAGSRTLNWIPFTVIDNVATFSLSLSLSLCRCGASSFAVRVAPVGFKKKIIFLFFTSSPADRIDRVSVFLSYLEMNFFWRFFLHSLSVPGSHWSLTTVVTALVSVGLPGADEEQLPHWPRSQSSHLFISILSQSSRFLHRFSHIFRGNIGWSVVICLIRRTLPITDIETEILYRT